VYHLLELVLGCGFFEDGERVPKVPAIAVQDLAISEKPYFPYRGFQIDQRYTAPYWSLDEWKAEIDWRVKKKLNLMWFSPSLVRGAVWTTPADEPSADPTPERYLANRRTWEALGLGLGLDTSEDETTRMGREVIEYARARGMEIASFTGFGGAVPKEFKEKNPDVQYFELAWEETAPTIQIDPRDPMYAQVMALQIREHIKIFGTDHRYEMGIYGESNPGSSREEGLQLRMAVAESVSKAIRAADPEGLWQLDSWCFQGHPDLSPAELERVLAHIPNDVVYILDIWGEAYHLYERYKFFFGKTWGFNVFHAMASFANLHGDIRGITQKANELLCNPDAAQCKYFTHASEIQKHNTLFYELIMRLAWDPRSLHVGRFLRDYAARRYGAESLTNMDSMLQRLLESVYSRDDWTTPCYQGIPRPPQGAHLTTRFFFVDKLREGLKAALEEKDVQQGNRLYLDDLTDTCRQFLAELFNYHWYKLDEAFCRADQEGVSHEAELVCEILRQQVSLLRLHPEYRLDTEVRRAVASGLDPRIAAKSVKARYTYLGLLCGCDWDQYPFLLDYARSDKAELIEQYYLPRVIEYIKEAKRELVHGHGKPWPFTAEHPTEKAMEPKYREIAVQFVNSALAPADPAADAETLASIPAKVEEILSSAAEAA